MKQRVIASSIAWALAAPVVWASDGAVALPEMTVSQGRPAVIADNPSPQAQVTQEQMREMNVVNVEDSLKYAPSLMIRKRYIGDRNGIIATRTSGTLQSARSLVYSDGLLLSNLLGSSFGFPPRWNVVGAEEIDTVDVLYGPFSAMLPGNSSGATVLMTTRRPERLEAHARVQAFSQHFRLYGTDDTYGGHQEQALVGGRAGGLSWTLFVNHLDSKGQPMSFATSTKIEGGGATVVSGGHRDKDPSGTNRAVFGATSMDHTVQDIAKFRLAYDFTPNTRAALTYAAWRNDGFTDTQTYLRNAAGQRIWSGDVKISGINYKVSNTAFAPTDSNADNRLLGLTLDSKLSPDWKIELAASDYGTPTDISRTPGASGNALIQPGAPGANKAGTITFADDTGWRNLDLKAIWKPNQGKAGHTVTFGYHWDEYRLSSTQYNATDWRVENSITTVKGDSSGKTSTTAAYVQDAWKFDPRWTATLGLRHERWEAFDGFRYSSTAFKNPNGGNVNSYAYPDRRDSFNSPKASLAWQASTDWLLRASLARAYRMPTVSELFQTETRGADTYVSDPSLKPEKVLAKDLTAEGTVLDGLLRISVFEEHVDDALYSQKDLSTNITSVQNIDRIRVRGIETAWQASDLWIQGLDFSGSITYADSEILSNPGWRASEGKNVPRIPKWRLSAFASYRIDEHWSASLGLKHSGRQYNTLDNSDINRDVYSGTSDFTTLDAKIGYRFGKMVRASLGVDNLTNHQYFVAHPMPLRTWHAELRIDY